MCVDSVRDSNSGREKNVVRGFKWGGTNVGGTGELEFTVHFRLCIRKKKNCLSPGRLIRTWMLRTFPTFLKGLCRQGRCLHLWSLGLGLALPLMFLLRSRSRR